MATRPAPPPAAPSMRPARESAAVSPELGAGTPGAALGGLKLARPRPLLRALDFLGDLGRFLGGMCGGGGRPVGAGPGVWPGCCSQRRHWGPRSARRAGGGGPWRTPRAAMLGAWTLSQVLARLAPAAPGEAATVPAGVQAAEVPGACRERRGGQGPGRVAGGWPARSLELGLNRRCVGMNGYSFSRSWSAGRWGWDRSPRTRPPPPLAVLLARSSAFAAHQGPLARRC